jgi:hypothetical protein
MKLSRITTSYMWGAFCLIVALGFMWLGGNSARRFGYWWGVPSWIAAGLWFYNVYLMRKRIVNEREYWRLRAVADADRHMVESAMLAMKTGRAVLTRIDHKGNVVERKVFERNNKEIQ